MHSSTLNGGCKRRRGEEGNLSLRSAFDECKQKQTPATAVLIRTPGAFWLSRSRYPSLNFSLVEDKPRGAHEFRGELLIRRRLESSKVSVTHAQRSRRRSSSPHPSPSPTLRVSRPVEPPLPTPRRLPPTARSRFLQSKRCSVLWRPPDAFMRFPSFPFHLLEHDRSPCPPQPEPA